MLEEIENVRYASSLVISNECLVRVMLDVNRLTLSIHLHRFSIEIVKSEQIVFGKLNHRPKKIESEEKIVVNKAQKKKKKKKKIAEIIMKNVQGGYIFLIIFKTLFLLDLVKNRFLNIWKSLSVPDKN